MKVTKSDEKLARVLLMMELYEIGWDTQEIEERVKVGWHGKLQTAKDIRSGIRSIGDEELDGESSNELMNRWAE